MLEKQESGTTSAKLKAKSKTKMQAGKGLSVKRVFTQEGIDPFAMVQWELRDAAITDANGNDIFRQEKVEVPNTWSQTATNVVVQKYFRGALGTKERETSVKQLIGRVVKTIAKWAKKQKYFASETDLAAFSDELTYLLVTQRAAFNSPVWFNVGVETHPQCSACFINSVEDKMESILGLAKTEGMLFKWGSGTGTNFSSLRSSKEQLAGGGLASGPVSFMKGFDAFAGVIKSGGKTRRAAKMVILNADHPDIMEYITCKSSEEKKAWDLIDAGYDGSFNGEAYASIFFQNSNNSVRVTDAFMEAVQNDDDWQLKSVQSGEVIETIPARKLMKAITEAAHQCGDPGIQFDTIINDWHTCPNTARINASNPCSEYMFLDDSACNLASLNLRKFQDEETGAFMPEPFMHSVEILLTAQEVLVDNAKYPTKKIERNSHKFRPLGLGYANLGALLMSRGLPYDSDAGRAYAGAITAMMHGQANLVSAKIAADRGAFEGYEVNREPMLEVMNKHRNALQNIDKAYIPYDMQEAMEKVWDDVVKEGKEYGFRNSQVTVLAPTGTIGFMMDCDTTGIEPDIALVKYKKLVGGGMMKIVNQTVPLALERLGYDKVQVKNIIEHIDVNGTIEGAEDLKEEHLPVFDCAFSSVEGGRSIHHLGHIKMMGVAQKFLSGAISKTVNMPHETTMADIEDAYMEAWKNGLKSIAIYRDGSKRIQALNTKKESETTNKVEEIQGPPPAIRHKLPNERRSITHKFNVGGHEGYLTVGLYEDGRPGEIFIVMAKEGSTISGLVDSFATAISLGLQHGVPLKLLVDKFSHTRFEPSGFSSNPEIGFAKSIMDYVFRWLGIKFPEASFIDQQMLPGIPVENVTAQKAAPAPAPSSDAEEPYLLETDAPPCHECGSIMVRSGACHKCLNCGATSGCS